jgi:hypothetical protein
MGQHRLERNSIHMLRFGFEAFWGTQHKLYWNQVDLSLFGMSMHADEQRQGDYEKGREGPEEG